MTVEIAQIDTPTSAEWDVMWRKCPQATFFHSPAWAALWEQHSGRRIRSVPERVTFTDGLQAIIPLSFEQKFQGLLNRHVSSPQGTFGGWIAADPLTVEHTTLLTGQLLDQPSRSLVWRMNPYDTLAFEAGKRRALRARPDETHALDLSVGAKALLSKFKNGYKSDVKKATKRGHISVDVATSLDEWRAYYRVYEETLERWGHATSDGYPWELFETMANLGSDDIKLWIARYDGAIVSGELCMYAQRHVVSWHAATLRDYLRSHVAKVQIYRVIVDACERGLSWFDFNPSAGLDGVRVFKESFNAKPLPAPVVYVDSTLKRVARSVASSLNVPYAELSLKPLKELVTGSTPPSAPQHPA